MQLIFTVDKEIMTLLDMETRPILNLGEADPNCKLVDGALFKVSAVKDMVEAAQRRERRQRRQRHGRSRLFVCVCVPLCSIVSLVHLSSAISQLPISHISHLNPLLSSSSTLIIHVPVVHVSKCIPMAMSVSSVLIDRPRLRLFISFIKASRSISAMMDRCFEDPRSLARQYVESLNVP